jgi:hypothetical protein
MDCIYPYLTHMILLQIAMKIWLQITFVHIQFCLVFQYNLPLKMLLMKLFSIFQEYLEEKKKYYKYICAITAQFTHL